MYKNRHILEFCIYNNILSAINKCKNIANRKLSFEGRWVKTEYKFNTKIICNMFLMHILIFKIYIYTINDVKKYLCI